MDELADILEHELETAVEVKDKSSLHRYIQLLVERTVGRRQYESDVGDLKSDVRLIADRMEQGFQRMDDRFRDMDRRFEAVQTQMDKRFEAAQKQSDVHFESLQTQMDRRFDDNQKRFRMMFLFITVGFTVLTTLVTLYQFLI